MVIPKASLLVLAAATLLVSCCYASRSPLATRGDTQEGKATVSVPIMSSDPSNCEWMYLCRVDKCTEHCVRFGLGNDMGFCRFQNLQCCCPITLPRAATKMRVASSAKPI